MMKPLNQLEVEQIAEVVNDQLRESPLQEVLVTGSWLLLKFYPRKDHWVLLDLDKQVPMVVNLGDKVPFGIKKEKKPTQLFIHAHLVGQKLLHIEAIKELGRVLRFQFSHAEIELRLIPRQVNLVVRARDRQVSWEKTQPLEPSHYVPDAELEVRTLAGVHQEWMRLRKGPTKELKGSDPQQSFEARKAKDIEKKMKAIGSIEELLKQRKSLKFRALGEAIKSTQSLDVPDELAKLVQREKTMAENMEMAFQKAKSIDEKELGTIERLAILRREVTALQAQTYQQFLELSKGKAKSGGQKFNAENLKVRKMELGEGLVAYLGKSASDNLKLLRKARAWDFWLHLKDYPSAHAILFREKNQYVSPQQIASVGQWLAQESLSATQLLADLDILICESRFVRPIKGDKVGRVHFSNEKVQRIFAAPHRRKS